MFRHTVNSVPRLPETFKTFWVPNQSLYFGEQKKEKWYSCWTTYVSHLQFVFGRTNGKRKRPSSSCCLLPRRQRDRGEAMGEGKRSLLRFRVTPVGIRMALFFLRSACQCCCCCCSPDFHWRGGCSVCLFACGAGVVLSDFADSGLQ